MTNDKNWFISERSEALAALLLTSRSDVRVSSEQKRDDGVDLLVEIGQGEPLSTKLLVVQVKGTMSSDNRQWIKTVHHLFNDKTSTIYLPTCVFVINVRDNQAWYAWIAEPLVQNDGAKLQFHPTGEFHELDKSTVDDIVECVKGWYDVLAQQLTQNSI